MGEDLLSSDSKAIKMGNAELTRLWNLCPDNMAACLSDKRCHTSVFSFLKAICNGIITKLI